MKLLLDHHLSPRLARALHALFDEHVIVALRDKFDIRASDEEWITALDREGGWAVLTMDLRIRTRPHERAAMDRSRIVFFFLAGAWRGYAVEEQAARLIRLMPKIAAQVDLAERGRFELPINAGSKLRPHRD
ncbi:PIN-like domain-containing protein [Xanthobacter versatilis]|uniref:PIN-like domain-containing protein n=1 Tax=Xanthobacter autotrophicus (strain ATCC BAA-1158 / Py2) TaxID=78245 RepID=UPI0037291020